jgi:hypothetical protein
MASAICGILALAVVAIAIPHQAFAGVEPPKKECCPKTENTQVAVGGNGGSGGAGGAGGEGGNGGDVKGAGGNAFGGDSNGGHGGNANGGLAADVLKSCCEKQMK